MMWKWLGLVAAMAPGLAMAEGMVVLQISAGADRVEVTTGQISMVTIENIENVPAVRVALVPALDEALRSLTAAHLGEVVTFKVCNEVVMQPVLQEALSRAEFMLGVTDGFEARRIAGLLTSVDCQR